jgi:prephenate dehydratase
VSSKHRPRVAFQGERGAFSEDAAVKLLGPDIVLVPRATFDQLFSSVVEGVADYALAPVENTLVGNIQPCIDLLFQSEFTIKDEVTIPIAQHLIGCPGSSFKDIETVESHPVALAQCQRFFAAHPQLGRIEADDTAGSVARVVAEGNLKRAAIGGKRAAELYGGFVIRENVQDRLDNCTRFLLLSRIEPKLKGPI